MIFVVQSAYLRQGKTIYDKPNQIFRCECKASEILSTD